jgi:hypothetical protein
VIIKTNADRTQHGKEENILSSLLGAMASVLLSVTPTLPAKGSEVRNQDTPYRDQVSLELLKKQ